MPEKPPVLEVSVADIWKLLDGRISPLGNERVPLADARGRRLLAEVKADTDQPPFDRSAVDGYALIPAAAPAKYRVIGVVKAGEVAPRAPGPGEALRIFTGAQVPATGLAVLMQEDAQIEGDYIHVERSLVPDENVRVRGSDIRKGMVILPAEIPLGPVELAILASVGQVQPLVRAKPRVAHATTGDEIVPPNAVPGPGQIRNSNQILIAAMTQSLRIPAGNIHQEHWGDDPAHAAARLAAEPFASADIVLISGGASVGEHDYAARILEGAGYNLPVRQVNSRPGRPLIVGFRGRQIAFGLPGNPVSHFVCFNLFVGYALCRLMGWDAPKWQSLSLSAPIPNSSNRRPTYWPARQFMAKGVSTPVLLPLPWNNSGNLAALAGANTLIFVPPDTPELPEGAKVDTLFVGPLFGS